MRRSIVAIALLVFGLGACAGIERLSGPSEEEKRALSAAMVQVNPYIPI